jgi:hypothetical protein
LTPARIGRRLAELNREIEAAAKPKTSAAAKPLQPVKPAALPQAPDPAKQTDAQWWEQRRKARLAA